MRSIHFFGAACLASTALTLVPSAAYAAAAVAAEAAPAAEDSIIVTGTRLNSPNLKSQVPLTSITADQLFAQGTISVGDALNELPQLRPTFTQANSGRNIGTAGISALDLRGQGTARTLVLTDGRRMITATPGINRPDVNDVPTDLIDRIDIVTGGNSAIYGSDAVAGVVNFILKQNFDGVKATAQGGVSSRGDAGAYLARITAGHNFNEGRGNIAVSAEYSKQQTLYNTDRDNQTGALSGRNQFNLVQNVGGNSNPANGAITSPEPAAGDGIPDNQFFHNILNNNISTGGLFTAACPTVAAKGESPAAFAARRGVACTGLVNQNSANPLGQFGSTFVFNPDGSLIKNPCITDFRPFNSSNCQGGLGSSLRETGIIIPGTVRREINILGHYEVSPGFVPYFRAQYAKVTTNQEGQPTFNNITYSLSNPFLSTQARTLLQSALAPGATTFSAFRFNTDFGGRGEEHNRENYQATIGAKGSFFDTWKYDVSFNYSRIDTFYKTNGNVLTARYANSVDAVLNGSGQIVCRINATTVTDPACVPVNTFGFGTVSKAALGYFGYTSSRVQRANLYDGNAYIAGDSSKLFSLPGGPIAFVLGGEIRRETAYAAYDATTAAGLTFLNSIPTFAPPAEVVKEGYGEISFPIVKDVKFIKELTVDLAGRVSNYNIGGTGTVYTYNASGSYSPVSDIRFRGGYSRAVRAPTQSDLYAPLSQTFLNGLVDPCGVSNINANPNRVKNCAAAGVPTTQTFTVGGVPSTEPFSNIPSSGISGFNGSNSKLNAEVSNSLTLGAVITPRFIPGFSLTLDYYRIEIKNVINSLAAQTIINQCYDSTTGVNNPFCASIFRNPNGTFAGQSNVQHAGTSVTLPTSGPSFISGPFNYAKQLTSGLDIDAVYNVTFNNGIALKLRSNVTHTFIRNNFTNIQDPAFAIRQLSTLGDPSWEGNFSANLITGMFNFGYRMRYIGQQTVAGTFEAQNAFQGRPAQNADQYPFIYYPTVTYHDLRVDISPPKTHFKFYLGVNNLTDKLPPYDLLGTENGDPFNPLGRSFYAGVELKF